jgi:N-acetylglucosaminyldiphosphoundecaprenol N-acetyl-beta-D-mannosaminyltransferase
MLSATFGTARMQVIPVTKKAEPARAIRRLFEHLTPLETAEDEARLLDRLRNPTGPTIVSFLNAHAVNLAWNSPELAEALLASDVLLRDGVGVEIALKRCGLPVGRNSNGTDLIPRIADRYRGRRVAVYGTRDPWLADAAAKLTERGNQVVDTADGFASDTTTYVERFRTHSPDLVILAMGMPKQELIAVQLRAAAGDRPVVIVNGGAIADFLAGKVSRAPKELQALRLEWVFRLVQEPRRLFKRYVIGNAVFLAHNRHVARVTDID